MKRIILAIIVISFSLLAILLIAGMAGRIKKNDVIAGRISRLPLFSLPAIDNSSFSSAEIKEGPLLIVYFHPECDYCRHELSELFRSNIFENGISMLLVSGAERDSVSLFLAELRPPYTDRMVMLIDTAALFHEIFGHPVIPSNFLYDRDLNLINSFYGEYKVETLIAGFSENE